MNVGRKWPPIIAGMSLWERHEFFQWLEWLRIDPKEATDEQLIRAANLFYEGLREHYPENCEDEY